MQAAEFEVTGSSEPAPLLQVEDLKTYFSTPSGIARAVDGVSFRVEKGRTLAIVGESGCGKSMTALSIMQLVPQPAGYVESGRILLRGHDLLDLDFEAMRQIRGSEIGMIFQEPMTSLNPVLTVGHQVDEALIVHRLSRGRSARERSIELLKWVGLPEPLRVYHQYPHELSGGMRQRAMIAIALACEPDILIADEPTTALDVTVQAQILNLIARLQSETGMAVLLITHDLGIVAEMANDVAVMYAGQFVETAPILDIFRHPEHPYTRGLFASLPQRGRRGQALSTIEGTVPEAIAWPEGCRFEPRCPDRLPICATQMPPLREVRPGHAVACHIPFLEIDGLEPAGRVATAAAVQSQSQSASTGAPPA